VTPAGPARVLNPVRILIVDDSAVMRRLLRTVIASDAGLEVAGTAGDGASALSAVDCESPDLILLDVEMPVMDGLATLRELRARGHKMPVIMCSGLTQRGARVAIEALASGASDYVAKPSDQSGRDEAVRTLARELIPKIRALAPRAPAGRSRSQPASAAPAAALAIPASPHAVEIPSAIPMVLTIAVSTGGPAALDVLLPALPAGFPLPVLVVQHMPEVFTGPFAERLSCRCPLPVHEAREGEPVSAGVISIARGNWHMEISPSLHPGAPATLHLHQGPLENHCRPAADVLFRSAAQVYGAGVLAVVLTGMGSDGLAGCRMVRAQGGRIIAQDQASSTVWGMPGAVAQAGLANRVLPLTAIAQEILRSANRAIPRNPVVRTAV
jgi:two-component system, chemotaxis family, protein-glutamate methylesterase/glutaminase